MTISSALANAMSGLQAAGRSSQTISANVANAMNPAYGVRSVALSASEFGGVGIDGIVRRVDPAIVADKRLAEAEFTNASDVATFLNRVEQLVGTPDEPDSLSARISEFENSLIVAASRPDAPERLKGVVSAARDITTQLNKASNGVQQARSDADRKLGVQVDRLNSALADVDDLNEQITKTIVLGGDPSALYDNRQALVDEISALVPVRQVQKDNGKIALYSTGGAILLDSSPAEIEFTTRSIVTAVDSIDGGPLSGLEINGIAVRTSSDRGALKGGSIAAQFEIRDELAVTAQSQLDAFTRDLVERFQDPAVDASLGVNDPGLFTINGAAFDPLPDIIGISANIDINAAVEDPNSWRIRDGIGATGPGDVGDARQIRAFSETILNTRTPASGNFGAGDFSLPNLLASLTSQFGAERARAEQKASFASSQFDEITQQLLAGGVDTDEELQRLILVEQSYAANARMIEAADEMMQTLLRI